MSERTPSACSMTSDAPLPLNPGDVLPIDADTVARLAREVWRLRERNEELERDNKGLRLHLSPPPPGTRETERVRQAAASAASSPEQRRPKSSPPFPEMEPRPRPDLLPAEALLAAGACLADRTDRDTDGRPWFDSAPLAEALEKYRASLLRHVLAYYADEKTDPKSHRPALAHVITNASILYRLENRATIARQGKEL